MTRRFIALKTSGASTDLIRYQGLQRMRFVHGNILLYLGLRDARTWQRLSYNRKRSSAWCHRVARTAMMCGLILHYSGIMLESNASQVMLTVQVCTCCDFVFLWLIMLLEVVLAYKLLVVPWLHWGWRPFRVVVCICHPRGRTFIWRMRVIETLDIPTAINAPVLASKKKDLPSLTRPTPLHVESERHDVRESFRAEIVVPIKRIALHFESWCAPLACGKGVECVGSVGPTSRTRLRNRAGGRAANESWAWRSWPAGGSGKRLQKERGEETDYMLVMRLDKGSSKGRILVIKYVHPGWADSWGGSDCGALDACSIIIHEISHQPSLPFSGCAGRPELRAPIISGVTRVELLILQAHWEPYRARHVSIEHVAVSSRAILERQSISLESHTTVSS